MHASSALAALLAQRLVNPGWSAWDARDLIAFLCGCEFYDGFLAVNICRSHRYGKPHLQIMFLLNSAGFHKQMHLTYVKIISKLVVLWSRFAIRFVAPNEWDDGWCQHTCVCDILVTFNNSGNIIVIINHNNLTNIVVYHTRIHTLHTLHTLHYITLHYITCMHGMHACIHTYNIHIHIYIISRSCQVPRPLQVVSGAATPPVAPSAVCL